MPASSDRLLVRLLRPWMPAENDPAEPNALMQSLQLTCSLTPSSTVPSTRLVIIWLKRCLARSLIELPLESAPVVVGVGSGDDDGLGDGDPLVPGVVEGLGDGEGLAEGVGDGDTVGVGVGVGVRVGVGVGVGQTIVVVAEKVE